MHKLREQRTLHFGHYINLTYGDVHIIVIALHRKSLVAAMGDDIRKFFGIKIINLTGLRDKVGDIKKTIVVGNNDECNQKNFM